MPQVHAFYDDESRELFHSAEKSSGGEGYVGYKERGKAGHLKELSQVHISELIDKSC